MLKTKAERHRAGGEKLLAAAEAGNTEEVKKLLEQSCCELKCCQLDQGWELKGWQSAGWQLQLYDWQPEHWQRECSRQKCKGKLLYYGKWIDTFSAVRRSTKSSLRREADPATAGKPGWTALHFAAFKGHDEVVDLLLKHGASAIHQSRNHGNTPLHLAAQEGHQTILERFFKEERIEMINIGPGYYRIYGKSFDCGGDASCPGEQVDDVPVAGPVAQPEPSAPPLVGETYQVRIHEKGGSKVESCTFLGSSLPFYTADREPMYQVRRKWRHPQRLT